jgi:plasmid maintenance system antidote protein VapI/Zn-dependent peptidase ImmA (M78 family)
MTTKHFFDPDYAVHPGATLKEALDERDLSQSEFSTRTGLTEKTISQIINGVAPISYETAEKFELTLGIPASFWNNRESNYRAALLRIEELARLESEKEWLEEIPVNELIGRGYIQACDGSSTLIREVLRFFQVSSVEAWKAVWEQPQVQFHSGKKAHDAHPGYVAAWLRMGEIEATKVECAPYDEHTFKRALAEIRKMTMLPAKEWKPKLESLCAAAGVAVIWIPELPKAGVSGITRWLSKDRALILLSLKYKRNDQVWFSFFHEACHVLKHGKKIIFYERGKLDDDELEKEANDFAANILIPREHSSKLPFLKGSRADIRTFAAAIGIAPGIVVGRMQHEKIIPPSYCNDLKVVFKWGKAKGSDE